MASSYTPLLRLTLPTTGELQGTWGDTVNNGITSLTEAAIAGTAAIVMSDANHTLTVANGATDEARRMFVTLTGALTATRDVICPAVSKMYVVRNNTTGGQSIVFKTSAGTGITVANGQSALLYCDGTNVVEAFSAFSGSVTLPAGTANGVAYLNGSKVLTTGSALTFDGSTFATTGNMSVPIAKAYYCYTSDYGIGTPDLFGLQLFCASGDVMRFGSRSAGTFSEQMRLTSTGLGIGTSSPSEKLDVSAIAGSVFIRFRNSSASGGYVGYNGDALTFLTNTTERMRLDASGNLGLGVVPSAWNYGGRVLELTNNGFLAVAGPNMTLGTNQFFNGSNFVYKINGAASYYSVSGGQHIWGTAPSGTAGSTISFTQAMTLDANGNLLVGTSGRAYNDNSQGSVFNPVGQWLSGTPQNSGANMYLNAYNAIGTAYTAYFLYNGAIVGNVSVTGAATAYNTSSDYRLKDITGPVTNSGAYIDALRPVEGTWKADGSTFVGLIAHEVQEVSRTIIATGEKDGAEMQAMDYSSAEIIANLIAELQSLRKRVAALEAA